MITCTLAALSRMDQPVYAFIFGLVIIGAFIHFVNKLSGRSQNVVWDCSTVKIPLKQAVLSDLSDLLEEIRRKAFNCLKDVTLPTGELIDGQIRANVFLPNYERAGDGFAYLLIMPDERNRSHPGVVKQVFP